MTYPYFFFMGNPNFVPYINPTGNAFDVAIMKNCVEAELKYMLRDAVQTENTLQQPVRPSLKDPAHHFFTKYPSYTRIPDFVTRIHKNVRCNEAVVVCAMVLLDRIAEKNPMLKLTPYTCRRLVPTAIVVASKMTDDHKPDDLKYYSEVAQFYDPNLMGILEAAMLDILEWKVLVTFGQYLAKMSATVKRLGFRFAHIVPPEEYVMVAPKPKVKEEPTAYPPVTPPLSVVSEASE